MARILVVEDNLDLAEGLRHNLRREGYEVRVEEDGAAGLEAARELRPDLVVLDLMLPGADGFEVLEALRAEELRMPVLVLTARGEEVDKVRAFRLDADQYMTKPFGLLELLERVRMLLRRDSPSGTNGRPDAIRFGEVVVDRAAHRVTRGGEVVELRPKEYELLLALVEREGEAVSRQELLRDVWDHGAPVRTRTVDWHVSELRRKLEADPEEPRHIRTVWKVGYRFER